MPEQTDTPPLPAKSPPRFAGDVARSKTLALEWPLEYDGKVYTEIGIRRLTAREVDDFVEAVTRGDKDARLPLFDAPPEVLDGLDADDSIRLQEAAKDFLPRALRPVSANIQSGTAGTTSPSSQSGSEANQ